MSKKIVNDRLILIFYIGVDIAAQERQGFLFLFLARGRPLTVVHTYYGYRRGPCTRGACGWAR